MCFIASVLLSVHERGEHFRRERLRVLSSDFSSAGDVTRRRIRDGLISAVRDAVVQSSAQRVYGSTAQRS